MTELRQWNDSGETFACDLERGTMGWALNSDELDAPLADYQLDMDIEDADDIRENSTVVRSEDAKECESCAEGGERNVPGVRNPQNPDWSGYWCCEECATEYDGRSPVNSCQPDASTPPVERDFTAEMRALEDAHKILVLARVEILNNLPVWNKLRRIGDTIKVRQADILRELDAHPEPAPVYYDYGHQAWVEDGKYAECGHLDRNKTVPVHFCWACRHAGEEVSAMTARTYGTPRRRCERDERVS